MRVYMKIILLSPRIRIKNYNITSATKSKIVYYRNHPSISYQITGDIQSYGSGFFDIKINLDTSIPYVIKKGDINFDLEYTPLSEKINDKEYLIKVPIEYIWCLE